MFEIVSTEKIDYYNSWDEEDIDKYIENRRDDFMREWDTYTNNDDVGYELKNLYRQHNNIIYK